MEEIMLDFRDIDLKDANCIMLTQDSLPWWFNIIGVPTFWVP